MKYAYYPGCLAQESSTELDVATKIVAEKLGIELVELKAAACCGSGFANERDPLLNMAVNARTFAQAEQLGLDIVTVCSTCHGSLMRDLSHLKENEKLRDEVNGLISQVGYSFKGDVNIKHLLWVLHSDVGVEELKKKKVNSLKGLKVASFYGCHILRPKEEMNYEDDEMPGSMEEIVEAFDGVAIWDYPEKTKCCGYHVSFANEHAAFTMMANALQSAIERQADVMLTPCPICHLALDTDQPRVEKYIKKKLGIPVFHLPQLVAYGLGADLDELGLKRHMSNMKKVEEKLKS